MAEIVERFTFMIARMAPVDESDEVYVRESDYAALLERHRRLVEICKRIDAYVPGSGGHSLQSAGAIYNLHAALAEEVDDGQNTQAM
jgi:hypothetical protein